MLNSLGFYPEGFQGDPLDTDFDMGGITGWNEWKTQKLCETLKFEADRI